MQIKLFLFVSLLFCITTNYAQKTPIEVKYKAWGLHALRQYPFSQKADSIVSKLIAHESFDFYIRKPGYFRKTALDLTLNTRALEEWKQPATFADAVLYRHILKHYSPWLEYGHPVDNKPTDRALTLFLAHEYENSRHKTDSMRNIFSFISAENLSLLL